MRHGWGTARSAVQAVGVACPAMRQRAVIYAGTSTALANAPAPQRRGWREPPWGADGPPPGAGQRRASAWPHRVGGGQLHGPRAAPGQNPLRFRRSRYRAGQWLPACGLAQVRHAARAGRRGARHNGGCVWRGHQAKRQRSDWPRYMQQPVMLNGATRHSPRSPARPGRARCPAWPVLPSCASAPGFDFLGRWPPPSSTIVFIAGCA